jgi:chaperonin GroEL
MEEGVVPGGGVALLRAASTLSKVAANADEAVGIRIVEKALEAPIRLIAQNAGVDGRVVVAKTKMTKGSNGFDASSLEYRDLSAAGIVDPTKVVRLCIENAASIAGLLLMTEALVAEVAEEEDQGHD